MSREVAKNVAVALLWIAILAGGSWAIGEVVEDSSATAPAGQFAEPCADDDRACHEWHDTAGSELQDRKSVV